MLLLQNLICCQYQVTGKTYFQMWDVMNTPTSHFLKHTHPEASDCLAGLTVLLGDPGGDSQQV